jgi:hypothetical protein
MYTCMLYYTFSAAAHHAAGSLLKHLLGLTFGLVVCLVRHCTAVHSQAHTGGGQADLILDGSGDRLQICWSWEAQSFDST